MRQFGLSGRNQHSHQTPQHNYSALLRQNGSIRLHTTVNNNFSSYRVVHLHCRDPSHHLSLQDSIRTTTTTTTMSGEGRSNLSSQSSGTAFLPASRKSSQRYRCNNSGSQSTLFPAASKNDVYASARAMQSADSSLRSSTTLDHRMLQSQLSQLSSVGDANSLMDTEINSSPYHSHSHSNNSYRLKDLKNAKANKHKLNEDCVSLDSNEDWSISEHQLDQGLNCADQHETELCAKPVAPQIINATLVATQPLHSIAELNPTRSRLKLSRIISRREKDALVCNSSPRVELIRAPLPGLALAHSLDSNHPHIHGYAQDVFDAKRKPKHRTLDNLTDKLRWISSPKKNNNKNLSNSVCFDSHSLHQGSNNDDNTAPTSTLRMAYGSHSVPLKASSLSQENLDRNTTSNCLNYGTPLTLR